MRAEDNNRPTDLIEQAAKFIGCEPHEVSWYSWPEAFGSTAGPHGGAGGQAITTFQVFGFACSYQGGVMYCAGKWRKWPDVSRMRWHR